MTGPESSLTRDIPPLLDCRRWANLFQAAWILVFANVGACAGYRLVADGQWAGAAAGALLAAVAATFISGFVVMCLPPPPRWIDAKQSLEKYHTLRRRFVRLAWCYALGAAAAVGGPFVWPDLITSLWAGVALALMMCVCYAMLIYTAHVLGIWRCPSCDSSFGQRGVFARYPHVCRDCGFEVGRARP